LTGPTERVSYVVYSKDGNYIVAGSYDSNLYIYSASNLSLL